MPERTHKRIKFAINGDSAKAYWRAECGMRECVRPTGHSKGLRGGKCLQMLANACKCLQMLANACKCLQMLANACKCLQMLANACKCLQMLANACKCLQMLANACNSCNGSWSAHLRWLTESEEQIEDNNNLKGVGDKLRRRCSQRSEQPAMKWRRVARAIETQARMPSNPSSNGLAFRDVTPSSWGTPILTWVASRAPSHWHMRCATCLACIVLLRHGTSYSHSCCQYCFLIWGTFDYIVGLVVFRTYGGRCAWSSCRLAGLQASFIAPFQATEC